MSEKASENKYEGLNPSDIEELEQMRHMMEMMYQGSESGSRMIEFMVEQERLWRLLVSALEEVKEDSPKFYYTLLIAVRRDSQKFFDLINQINEQDPNMLDVDRLDASQMIGGIDDLRFSGLFTNGGFQMREGLITVMSDYLELSKVVDILKQLQVLMPELKPGEDYGI